LGSAFAFIEVTHIARARTTPAHAPTAWTMRQPIISPWSGGWGVLPGALPRGSPERKDSQDESGSSGDKQQNGVRHDDRSKKHMRCDRLSVLEDDDRNQDSQE
jgi:hypothetical protein